MAAPVVKNFTQAVLIDTGLIAAPSDTVIDDLVMCIVWSQGTGIPTHTLQSGFTEIRTHPHSDGTTSGRLSVAVYKATVAGAQNYTAYAIGAATAGQTCVGLLTITGSDPYTGGQWKQASLTDTGNQAPDPPALTGMTGDFLSLAIAAWQVTTAAATTATVMANYTLKINGPAATHVTHLAVSSRALTGLVNATEDPATYADNVIPNGTVAMTIGVFQLAFGHPTMRRWGGIPTMLAGNLIARTW